MMEILTEQDKLKTVQSISLKSMITPDVEGRWNPVPHHILDSSVTNAIEDKGLTITNKSYTIQSGTLYGDGGEKTEVPDGRMIALYTLGNGYGREEFSHQIAVRNSVDKKWAISMSAAQTVFVCTNGIMTGTRVLGRMNTTNVFRDLPSLVDDALDKITHELQMNDTRFDRYREQNIYTQTFNHLAMKAAKAGAITYGHLGKLAEEWDEPTQPEFKRWDQTLWRAFNCFTQVDKHRPLMTKQERTMKLIPLLDEVAGIEKIAA
jgi:hypothetical protein